MRVFYIFIFVLTCFVANAQSKWAIGGEFMMWRNETTDNAKIKIAPSVIYEFNPKFDFGVNLSYLIDQTDNTTTPHSHDIGVSVSPFVRHYLFSDNTVRVFCDYTAGYGYNGQAETRNGFEVGVKPGIALSLTEKINVITHIGFLGYRQDFCGLESGYGLKLNTEDISIGLIFNF